MKTGKKLSWGVGLLEPCGINSSDGYPYGSKGDNNWQIIALAEGWANYREESMTRTYLGDSNYVGTYNLFLSDYLRMFRELRAIGCSFQNMEKSLCTYSISGYRDNLIAKYPHLSEQITTIISTRL